MKSLLNSNAFLGLLAAVVYITTSMVMFLRLDLSAWVPKIEAEEGKPGYVYWGFSTNEINNLANSLKSEHKRLKAYEADLDARQARLDAEEKELSRLREDIESKREALSQYLVEVESTELKNLKKEVEIFNNMDPDNVVSVFMEKDDDEVVKILALMKADAIAPILEAMMQQRGAGENPTARAARLLEKLKRFQEKTTEI